MELARLSIPMRTSEQTPWLDASTFKWRRQILSTTASRVAADIVDLTV
jgi:hypothetical protein